MTGYKPVQKSEMPLVLEWAPVHVGAPARGAPAVQPPTKNACPPRQFPNSPTFAPLRYTISLKCQERYFALIANPT
ncbi:MAG: hypothetical protein WCR52_14720, partial [Bacteroidota bacterium]